MNKMYSAGDKVRIVNCLYGHRFNVGEIVTICTILTDSYVAKREVEDFCDRDWWYVYDDELEKVIPNRATIL